ncbi:MAG: site-specific integrase [Gemmatimonadota bacterium]
MLPLQRLLALYLRHASPSKGAPARAEDARRAELWARVLGPERTVATLSRRDWDSFVEARGSGAVGPRGQPVVPGARRAVRPRTVQADCFWLNGVLRWASTWRDEAGERLLEENPLAGLKAPRERNPRRPTAQAERYRRIRAVSDQIPMEIRWRGRRECARSHLSEILDLAHHTGRRLSAICALTYEDLRPGVGPHGSIRWPAATDKGRREMVVPLSPGARAAVERVLRERPGSGPRPLFPSPTDRLRPVSRHLADDWLRRAERRAGVEPQPGSLWHAYRRGWATARKALPDVDVAAAGGWKDAYTLKTVYQQPDAEGMLRAVLGEE